ncbi:MAG: HNH endonuclease [Dysgonamonadaceae bacterium]|jgi:hypothetical protein|nr:HNH endonuclease [Dysgonamonadaceae bacterium]
MKSKIPVKWETADLVFIRKNFPVMTWNRLLEGVNAIRPASWQVSSSALRYQVKCMGLSRGIQIRWSPEDIDFLRSRYTRMGNVEMAAKLNERRRTFRIIDGRKVFRTFTKRHVEKKLKLLGLHRTAEQIRQIKKRNLVTTGYRVLTHDCNLWTQGKRKAADEASVRIWKGRRHVKINGKFTPYTRWFYHNFIRPVPPGYMVYHLDCDRLNDSPDNLACAPHNNLQSFAYYRHALTLLDRREKKLLDILRVRNYGRQGDEIRQMHTDLNRIRKLQQKIRNKIRPNN